MNSSKSWQSFSPACSQPKHSLPATALRPNESKSEMGHAGFTSVADDIQSSNPFKNCKMPRTRTDHTRLSPEKRFQLMKEIEVLHNSERNKTLISTEFAKEMTRELRVEVNIRHLETCAKTFGWRMSDLFKLPSNYNSTSVYAEIVALRRRVDALEQHNRSTPGR